MTGVPMTVAPLVAAAAKTTNGNPIFLILIAVGAAFYFLIYRPQQRKAKAARAQGNAFDVGDEVLTAGGIVGHVIEIDGDRVTLETSVGASFVVLRQYVLRKIEEPVVDDDEYDDEAADEDDDIDHGVEDDPAAGETDEHAAPGETDDGTPEADGPESGTSGPTGKRKSNRGRHEPGGHGPDGPPIT